MKFKRVALLFLVSILASWGGYYFGAIQEKTVTYMPAGALSPLEFLVASDSFSEVEQTRAVLEGLVVRYLHHAQGLIQQEIIGRYGIRENGEWTEERPILAAIQMLEDGVAEFKGTGLELRLLPTLLPALKREGLYDRWLQIYLNALYQHPTHDLVATFAEDAVLLSKTAGREEEIAAAFRHLSGIPLELSARSKIERSLGRAGMQIGITCKNSKYALSTPQS